MPKWILRARLALAATLVAVAGCGGAEERRTLVVGAIPDQDPQQLQRLHGLLSDRLSERLGVEVRYRPVTDYAAAVTAFRVGDLDLVWFGGLTGVQARRQVPGARAIAQRDVDARLRSVFIASTASGLRPFRRPDGLRRLAGRRFTFGSESSTSGRLMPQLHLERAGVGLEDFRGPPGFSGSHDRTIGLVAAGSYDAGALNEQVWRDRLRDGTVDRDRVRAIWRTPGYRDYHWVLRPDVDERLGRGTGARIRRALLGLDRRRPADRRVLELFGADRFVPARAGDHRQIETVARRAGLLR